MNRQIACIDNYIKQAVIKEEDASGKSSLTILEWQPWTEDTVFRTLDTRTNEAISVDSNDIYHRYLLYDGLLRMTIISPASQELVLKYSQPSRLMIRETIELYEKHTLPYLDSLSGTCQWIYNILKQGPESEPLLFEGRDFVLVADSKWATSQKNNETTLHNPQNYYGIYLLAIYKGSLLLRSIRDLRGHHLEILKNVRQELYNFMNLSYKDLKPSRYRLFFHYLPTYPHLHIHLVGCDVNRPNGLNAGVAHFLDDVIDNLSTDTDYYATRTLSILVSEHNPLVAVGEKIETH